MDRYLVEWENGHIEIVECTKLYFDDDFHAFVRDKKLVLKIANEALVSIRNLKFDEIIHPSEE